MQYRTKDGDMIDVICRDYYGRESVAQIVLEANPRLADHGPILPAGLVIELPDIDQAVQKKVTRLWD